MTSSDLMDVLVPHPDQASNRVGWKDRLPQMCQHIRVTNVIMNVTEDWELNWLFGFELAGEMRQFRIDSRVLTRVQQVVRDISDEKKAVMLWPAESAWIQGWREHLRIRHRIPTAQVLALEVWNALSDLVQLDLPPFLRELHAGLPFGVSFEPVAFFIDDLSSSDGIYIWPRVNASLSSVTKGSHPLMIHQDLLERDKDAPRVPLQDQKAGAWRKLGDWSSPDPERMKALHDAQGRLRAYMVLVFCICMSNEIFDQIERRQNPPETGPAPQARSLLEKYGTI